MGYNSIEIESLEYYIENDNKRKLVLKAENATLIEVDVDMPSVLVDDVVLGTISYTHTQSIPESMWVIHHGLPFRPAGVYIEDTSGTNVEGDVSYPSTGVVVVSFSSAFGGKAYLS